MTTKLQDKIDKRANAWEHMKGFLDRQRAGETLSAEDSAAYDKAEAEYDALDVEIEREEGFAQREARNAIDRDPTVRESLAADQDPEAKAYATAFGRWMARGTAGLDADDQKVLASGFVDPSELKNAQSTTTTAGGYTIPPEFRDKIIETMNFVSNMRQDAELISTTSGADLPWPTNDDTANEGAILGENVAAGEQDFTFGTNKLGSFMYTSKIVRVSLQLLNDSAFVSDAWLARKLGERIGRIQQRHFTVGAGTTQPLGLFPGATVGKVAAGAAAVTTDELIDLQEAIDPLVLDGGNCQWEFHQTTRKAIRKLKDGQGRYLWEPSLTVGAPSTLLGYPVRLNNLVPLMATGNRSIGFGDVKQAYVIRDVQDLTMLRMAERYAEFLQVGFMAFQRGDATTQDTKAFQVLQQA